MKTQKGFSLIELLVVVAIVGLIAANVGNFFGRGTTNNETAANDTIFEQLLQEPLSSLNLTALEFMVDYCMEFNHSTFWLGRTTVYQNQIIINLLGGDNYD